MRLIDADTLKPSYIVTSTTTNSLCHLYVSIEDINFAPTIDAVEVRHGRWIFNPKDAIELMFTLPKCSECGHESPDALNYCPNCGADMRGIDDDR